VERSKEPLTSYGWIIAALAVAFSLFQMFTTVRGPFPEAIQRSIHLCFALVLVFLIYDFRGKKRRTFSLFNFFLALLCVFSTFYIVYFFEDLVFRQARINTADVIVGAIIVIAVIETSRRVVGLALVVMSVVFILYAYFGRQFPGLLSHSGLSIGSIVDRLVMDIVNPVGIFGVTLGVSTNYVFMYILFGSFFLGTGGTDFIMEFSKAFIGRVNGGAAKLAVVSSGIFGMFSGSASANVTVTGSVTIPLMKRTGFAPAFAAAVEATASSGGMIMPPVMGAAGFIIAETLGIPYVEVIKAAFLPAAVYFISCYFGVDFYAKKYNLPKIPSDEIPPLRSVLRKRGISAIPILVLIYLLVVARVSPGLAAFWATITMIVLNLFSKDRLGIKGIARCLKDGAEASLIVVTTLAIVGIPMCVIMTTGLGLKFGELLVMAGGGSLILILMLAMIASLILGTGVEATCAYLIITVLLIPALIKTGIQPIASHLFSFYFGVISNVTPPVAIASYVAAGLAQSNAFKSAVIGFRLSLAGFLIPYMLIYRSPLMMMGSFFEIAYHFLILILGVYAFQAASMGYLFSVLSGPVRVFLLFASVLLIFPNTMADIVGLVLIGGIISHQYLLKRRRLTYALVAGKVSGVGNEGG
jgi:TRAP transporter 4TM/12TM fusion protein